MHVGQNVSLEAGNGTIRFVGRTRFAPGEWVGVELLLASGKNDGSVDGHVYFRCPSKHGIFVRESKIRLRHSKGGPDALGPNTEKTSGSSTNIRGFADEHRSPPAANDGHFDTPKWLHDTETRLEMLAVEKEVLETENSRLKVDIAALQDQCFSLRLELDALAEEAAVTRELEQLVASQVDVSGLSSEEITLVLAKNRSLDVKVDQQNTTIQKIEAEVSRLTDQLHRSRARLEAFDQLEQKLVRSKEVIESLQAQVDTSQEVDQVVTRLTEENLELAEKMQELSNEVAELTELLELDKGLEENHVMVETELRETVRKLRAENQALARDIDELGSSNSHLRDKIDELSSTSRSSDSRGALGEFKARPRASDRMMEAPASAGTDCALIANDIIRTCGVNANISDKARARLQTIQSLMKLVVTSIEWSTVKDISAMKEILASLQDKVGHIAEIDAYESVDFVPETIAQVLGVVSPGKFPVLFLLEYLCLYLEISEITTKGDILAQVYKLRERLEKWSPEDDAMFGTMEPRWLVQVDLLLTEPDKLLALSTQLELFFLAAEKPTFKLLDKKIEASSADSQETAVRVRKIQDLEANIQVLQDALKVANIKHQESFASISQDFVELQKKYAVLSESFRLLRTLNSAMAAELEKLRQFESKLEHLHKDPVADSGLKKVSLRALAYKKEAEFLRRVIAAETVGENVSYPPLAKKPNRPLNPLGSCSHSLRELAASMEPLRVNFSTQWRPLAEGGQYLVLRQKEKRCRYESLREKAFRST